MVAIAILYPCILTSPATAGTLEAGAELDWLQYKEPGVMKEDGFLIGGFAAYSVMPITNLTCRLFFSCTAGSLRYDGSTMDNTPLEVDTPNYLLRLRALLGYQILFITPFTGLAVRLLNDDLSSNYSGGYERQTTYLYSPAGIEVRGTFGNNWTLGVRGEYDFFWGGLNRNLDYPLAYGKTDIELHQHSGYGIHGAFFVKHPLSKSLDLSVETIFQYWDIDKSDSVLVYYPDAVYELFEPANQCTLYGLRAGLCW